MAASSPTLWPTAMEPAPRSTAATRPTARSVAQHVTTERRRRRRAVRRGNTAASFPARICGRARSKLFFSTLPTTAPIRAALVWTDPAGTSTITSDLRSSRLRHNLDLKILAPDGTTHLRSTDSLESGWTGFSDLTIESAAGSARCQIPATGDRFFLRLDYESPSENGHPRGGIERRGIRIQQRPMGRGLWREPTVGFEPTTSGLQNRCSTTELCRRGKSQHRRTEK